MPSLATRPLICLVTDRHRLPEPRIDAVVALAAAAAAAGVQLIHLRERDLNDRDLLALGRRMARAVAPATLVVNERWDVAAACGAGGVHLRADSLGAARVRAVAPPGFVVGRSVHSAGEAARAAGTGVDYLVMGTVYPTSSKPAPSPVAGEDELARACRAVSPPVLAIGGVTADKLTSLAAAGAAGVAAIGLFADGWIGGRAAEQEARLRGIVSAIRAAFVPAR